MNAQQAIAAAIANLYPALRTVPAGFFRTVFYFPSVTSSVVPSPAPVPLMPLTVATDSLR